MTKAMIGGRGFGPLHGLPFEYSNPVPQQPQRTIVRGAFNMDHYFITYDSKTGEMSGHFVSSTKDITPRPRFPGEAVLEVTSKEHIEKLASITPRSSRVMGRVEGGRLKALEVGPIFAGRIALVCDRPDMDGDGMAELPADGETVARITAKLLDREGKGVAREGLKIKFHVTRGSLSAREVQAKKGTAEVELRAS